MQRAFVIRPFGTKKDAAGKEIDFEVIHEALIGPALQEAGLAGSTTGEIVEAGNVREDMFGLIVEADLVVCDVTIHNANVFYELGIRHALRRKHSVLIRGGPVADAPPFDILTDRYFSYDVQAPARAKDRLAEVLRATLRSDRETDSPIFKMLPTLPEVDPAAVRVVPQDLAEEVARAAAAGSAGSLRLLSQEVQGLRFQWPALRMIGKAQWGLKDYDGARRSWERVRDTWPDDLAANLALSNIYERLYAADRPPRLELLEASNQAIARALGGGRADAGQRAEALALRGRNTKTLWRLDFETLESVAGRRERAMNRNMLRAYDAYRGAYLADLNHHWSGLAALQMGTIGLDLARDTAWEDSFASVAEAKHRRLQLAGEVEALRAMVPLAIEATLGRLPVDDDERVWPEVSRVDTMFLDGKRPQALSRGYLDAILPSQHFVWDAAKRQLMLFACLGVRGPEAQQVIEEVEAGLQARAAAGGAVPAPDPAALDVVIFAGHRPDEPGRANPRFPAEKEGAARARIRAELERLRAGAGAARLRVLASAAPGADILCHEACCELGIERSVCLPMPAENFAHLAFPLDGWRARFWRLLDSVAPLQLSDRAGLPLWLQGTASDVWERGNRWVLEMARSAGARRLTMLVLWDGKAERNSPGGTGHMVDLARDAGNIELVVIDPASL
ncbi:tetratricopeptide repeat-containing protein [Roseomonas sp. GCM10028921]